MKDEPLKKIPLIEDIQINLSSKKYEKLGQLENIEVRKKQSMVSKESKA